ncbi:MAG: cysteine desulfurase, partial [Candidatus Marinimicrobia bacterium]|nr:cysteine desulfurase [Candidatus Neomarinimicrobiota bacterium]
LDIETARKRLTERTRLVWVVHKSNVFGTVNPVKEITKLAHQVDALMLLDGAQSVPHFKVDVEDLDCDFMAFSGHKMLGPTGVGVLYGKTALLESMEPFLGGGDMIRTVTMEQATWNDIPWKFEAGTPNIAQAIGLGAAVDYLNELGMDSIQQYVNELTEYGRLRLTELPGLTLYGHRPTSSAVLPFNIEGIHPHDVAQVLDDAGIAIRAGHHCAQPLMHRLNVAATCRASFYFYNTFEEIDRLVEGLKAARSVMGLAG